MRLRRSAPPALAFASPHHHLKINRDERCYVVKRDIDVMHKNMFTRTSVPDESHDIIAPHSRRRVFERVARLLETMQAGMQSCSDELLSAEAVQAV
jgi:hypothetical protein